MYKKKSAGMVLTNEIEHYMQQWNYIKIRQLRYCIFMFCIEYECHDLTGTCFIQKIYSPSSSLGGGISFYIFFE